MEPYAENIAELLRYILDSPVKVNPKYVTKPDIHVVEKMTE